MCVVDTFNVIQSVLIALSAVATAGAAWVGLTTWRRELVGRRKAELAEDILTKAYEARHALEAVRFPISVGDEGSTRPPLWNESADQEQFRNAIYTPVERLGRYHTVFSELEALRFRLMAFYGDEAGRPIQELFSARERIVQSAFQMIRNLERYERGDLDTTKWEQWGRDIGWDISEDPDPVAERANDAVTNLERLCGPALQGKA